MEIRPSQPKHDSYFGNTSSVLDLLNSSTRDNNKGFINLQHLQKLNWMKTV